MLIIKDDSVELNGLNPELAMIVASTVVPCFDKFGLNCVITSGSEQGVHHSKTSLHYTGAALDIRTTDQMTGERFKGMSQVFNEIKAALNCDFDLIDEGNHLHLEYQPKRR